MNRNEFSQEIDFFIQELKSSSLYQEMIHWNQLLSESETLKQAAHLRDESFYLSSLTENSEEKKEYQIKAREQNDSLLKSNEVQNYLRCYRDIKDVIALLNEAIFKELNND